MARNAMHRLSDLATKGDVVQAIQQIILPLTTEIDRLALAQKGLQERIDSLEMGGEPFVPAEEASE